MQHLFYSFLLLLAGGFCIDAVSRTSRQSRARQPRTQQLHAPPQLKNLDPNRPLMSQLIQEDFLVTPDDFSKDPDVNYVLNQLHRSQTVDKFYRTAQTVYRDLGTFYAELSGNPELAVIFHECMKRITESCLSRPLTITNLILGITRHFRPIFKTRSGPIEEMAMLIAKLELDPEKKMIRLMSKFFDIYTIREIDQIQNIISLSSYAGVDPFTARQEAQIKQHEDSLVAQAMASLTQKAKTKKPAPTQRRSSTRKQSSETGAAPNIDDNYFEVFLKPVSERSRVIIANAITKMLILLDLFINDPTMPARSIQLYIKLWLIHSKRLAIREKVDVGDLDLRWIDPSLYRKFPISFLYDDWAPGILSPEAMAELRQAALEEAQEDRKEMAEEAAKISQAKLFSNLKWIGSILLIVGTVIAFTAFAFLKFRQFAQEKESSDEIADIDDAEGSGSEIVRNLERNIDI